MGKTDRLEDRTIAAIVPMRHHSERVPGKNYREFAGKPLFHHIINTLLGCNAITKVGVDTDSDTIKEQCASEFPEVFVLDRPTHLQAGEIPMNEVLLNSVDRIEADFYLQTHSTNPLLSSETLAKAIEQFCWTYPSYDSMFSVTRLQTRLWDQLARPINHNKAILLRTQDLPPVYEENSCFYLFTKQILEERHNRIGTRPFMFEVDPMEAMDIDTEIDFRISEMIFKETKKHD